MIEGLKKLGDEIPNISKFNDQLEVLMKSK